MTATTRPTDERIELVAQTLADVAAEAAEEASVPPAALLREAAAELVEKLDDHAHALFAHMMSDDVSAAAVRAVMPGIDTVIERGLSTSSGDDAPRPPVVETDRDAVRIVEAVLLEDDPVDPTAERIVRALLGVPTLHRRPDGTLVADWHDTPEHTPRAALVARPLLDDIVSAQSREGGDLHVARTAIDVLLDVTAGVREALADPFLGKRHASRLFDSADRILDTLRAIHPYEPPAPVVVEQHAEPGIAEQLRAELDKLAAAEHDERRPVWPDPEVAVDLIDHTDEHDGDGVIEHLSPDCKARKCGACIGSAWSPEADALVECTHPCHTPVSAP